MIFATRDRATQLRQTLDSYRRLNTDGIRWELIVVDNNSDDDTAAILEHARSDLPLIPLFAADGGQNRARNTALPHLNGELIIFTDDDAVPNREYLQAYASAAARWPHEAVFGARIEPRFPDNTPNWMQSPAFRFSSTAFARYAPASKEGRVRRHPYGPSFAVRRSALGQHCFPNHLGPQGGSYAMGGEGHLLRRLRADGWSFIYVPSACVEHVIRPDQITTEWLLARANKKGRGQVYLPNTRKPRKFFVRGISVKLWLATARAALRYRVARLICKPRVYTEQGIQYQLRLGQIQEMLARRRRGSDGPDDPTRPATARQRSPNHVE
ncbi:hypothetical protein GCM10028792_25920 [Salinisphaera aquimarina]